jgi:regulator of replication initiation timing
MLTCARLEFPPGAAVSESDVQHRLDESMREVEHLRAENERLRTLLTLSQRTQAVVAANGTAKKQTADLRATPVDSTSDASTKVALMRLSRKPR